VEISENVWIGCSKECHKYQKDLNKFSEIERLKMIGNRDDRMILKCYGNIPKQIHG
jgi:hypothetical protein